MKFTVNAPMDAGTNLIDLPLGEPFVPVEEYNSSGNMSVYMRVEYINPIHLPGDFGPIVRDQAEYNLCNALCLVMNIATGQISLRDRSEPVYPCSAAAHFVVDTLASCGE